MKLTNEMALWNVLESLEEESTDIPTAEYKLLLEELIIELNKRLSRLC